MEKKRAGLGSTVCLLFSLPATGDGDSKWAYGFPTSPSIGLSVFFVSYPDVETAKRGRKPVSVLERHATTYIT
jgi:hypothetical protein